MRTEVEWQGMPAHTLVTLHDHFPNSDDRGWSSQLIKVVSPPLHLRWPGFVGQFGGFAKLGSGSRQAANRVSSSALVPIAPYASSGVRPFSPECGRRPL